MKKYINASSNTDWTCNFEDLERYKDSLFANKRNNKLYEIVGTFIGFDGVPYVALKTYNRFTDKSYMKFSNFINTYYPYED